MTATTKKPSRRRRLVFVILIWMLLLVLLEAGTTAYYYFAHRLNALDYPKIYAEEIEKTLGEHSWNLSYKSHPFFGYVCDPTLTGQRCNNFGFRSTHPFPYKKSKDEVVLGIFGGSLASSFGRYLEKNQQALAEKWSREIPNWKDKKIVFINFALGGYKQPQQYYVLSYFIETIDVALMVDGINEINTAPSPQYPTSYPKLMFRFFDEENGDLWRKKSIEYLRATVNTVTTWALDSKILSHSSAYFFLWSRLQQLAGHYVHHFSRDMVQDAEQRPSPFYAQVMNEEQQQAEKIEIWKKYSRMGKTLLDERHIPLYHFVQPNQYGPKRKAMLVAEKNIAIVADPQLQFLYDSRVQALQKSVPSLRALGLPTVDLTELFLNVQEPVFIDNCCHINEVGNGHLADAILTSIRNASAAH